MKSWKTHFLAWGILASVTLPALAQEFEYYAVKPLDTVEKLAALQRVSCDSILQLNPSIKNGLLPPPGSIIFLPPATPTPYHPRKVADSTKRSGGSAHHAVEKAPKVEHVRDARPGLAGELSEEEIDALYEGTVKPLGGRVADAASTRSLALSLPEHQNTVIGSDGHVTYVPEARSKAKFQHREEPAESPTHRGLSSRRGLQAQAVLRSALKFMGVPYVWGGQSPSGFDCSGFVQHVYGLCGIALPRTADLQFNVGQAVPAGREQPGDLIFFETYCPGPSHIGIFLGRHQFVHASSAAGQITISDLREAHFQRCYLGAKRVF